MLSSTAGIICIVMDERNGPPPSMNGKQLPETDHPSSSSSAEDNESRIDHDVSNS